MAYDAGFIFGKASCAGRLARRTAPGVEHGHKGFVVVLELRQGVYDELDADSAEHAETIGRAWVDNGMCLTASVQQVRENGGIKCRKIIAPEPEAAE